MPKATWSGTLLAQSDTFETVGNVYFPPGSLVQEHFRPSATHTTCGWKGEASYYDVVVDGQENRDAAWFYPSPKPAAKNITGYWPSGRASRSSADDEPARCRPRTALRRHSDGGGQGGRWTSFRAMRTRGSAWPAPRDRSPGVAPCRMMARSCCSRRARSYCR